MERPQTLKTRSRHRSRRCGIAPRPVPAHHRSAIVGAAHNALDATAPEEVQDKWNTKYFTGQGGAAEISEDS